MLRLDEALRIEGQNYIFKCSECPREVKSKAYYLKLHSGKCRSCMNKKAPFAHVYKRFCSSARNDGHENHLSYLEFLALTHTKRCHYCDALIPWKPYCYKASKYESGGYFLDRKDNAEGYVLSNVAVCCTDCNKIKGARFTYAEFTLLAPVLKSIRGSRRTDESLAAVAYWVGQNLIMEDPLV